MGILLLSGDRLDLLDARTHQGRAGDVVVGGDGVVAPAHVGDVVEKVLPGGESIVIHLHVVDVVVDHLDKAGLVENTQPSSQQDSQHQENSG